MSKPHVWVVECLNRNASYYPCVGSELTRKQAEKEKNVLECRNPDYQFRVAKYVRVEPTAKRRKRK